MLFDIKDILEVLFPYFSSNETLSKRLLSKTAFVILLYIYIYIKLSITLSLSSIQYKFSYIEVSGKMTKSSEVVCGWTFVDSSTLNNQTDRLTQMLAWPATHGLPATMATERCLELWLVIQISEERKDHHRAMPARILFLNFLGISLVITTFKKKYYLVKGM